MGDCSQHYLDFCMQSYYFINNVIKYDKRPFSRIGDQLLYFLLLLGSNVGRFFSHFYFPLHYVLYVLFLCIKATFNHSHYYYYYYSYSDGVLHDNKIIF